MDQTGNDKMRTAISIIFSFLLCVAIPSLILVTVASLTITNEGYMNYSINKSRYVDRSYDNFSSILEEEAANHDLPEDIMSCLLDKDRFENDLNNNIILANKGQNPNMTENGSTSFVNTVETELTAYLEDNQIGDNKWVETAVDEITLVATNYYQKYTSFPFGNYISEFRNTVSGYVKVFIPVLLIISALLIMVVLKLYSDIYSGWRYVLTGLLASGLISIIFGIIIYVRTDYTFSEIIKGYESFINLFFDGAAAAFIICGVAVIILAIIGTLIIKRNEEKQEPESEYR